MVYFNSWQMGYYVYLIYFDCDIILLFVFIYVCVYLYVEILRLIKRKKDFYLGFEIWLVCFYKSLYGVFFIFFLI